MCIEKKSFILDVIEGYKPALIVYEKHLDHSYFDASNICKWYHTYFFV